jgi:ElaB/YqjD/DUF883 family membrane-anchored ribosome-binding protein
MDQPRAQATARDAAENAGKAASEAVQRVGAQIQPVLDQGKSVVQDLANQASEVGRQAVGQAGDLLQNVAPQAKEAASNLYQRGSQSGEYVRQYTAEQPIAALLVAGAIGYGLAYLIHRR